MIAHASAPSAPAVGDLPEPFRHRLLARLDGDDLELPLLPSMVWELIQLSDADQADARQFTELIHRDQALAAHVMRVANSAAFRPRMPLISLQQAVSWLGTDRLVELAFTLALRSRVFHVPGYEADLRALWEHAVATAIYAKAIARSARTSPDGAFICGLLHDIGKPLVLQLLVDLQDEVGVLLAPPLLRAAMETYHVLAGSRLASCWALPLHVSESILSYHVTQTTPVCADVVAVVRLADALASHILAPAAEAETAPGEQFQPLLADLSCHADDLELLLAQRSVILGFVEAMW
jgi:putative nucleotidyltransferase with HDIG domain